MLLQMHLKALQQLGWTLLGCLMVRKCCVGVLACTCVCSGCV